MSDMRRSVLTLDDIDWAKARIEELEAQLAELDAAGMPAFAQCEYGNGPLTSMRPVARPER